MFDRRVEELKEKIIDDGVKKNLISKQQSQGIDDEFILNYAKNNNFDEYVLLNAINNAKFTVIMRDKSSKSKLPLHYENQMADDIFHLWMSGVPEDQLLSGLKEAIDNGTTYINVGQKDFNIILESLYNMPVASGGLQGLGEKVKELILDYKKRIDAVKSDAEKKKIRDELLMMICGFYEIDIGL